MEELSEEDLLEKARSWAHAALRPATLAAEFQVTEEEVVEAIAAALLPFLRRAVQKGLL